jgi:hypothetical protein
MSGKGRPSKDGIDYQTYRTWNRAHMPHEHAALEASLKEEGCRDALVVGVLDGKRYLIDGFQRKALCDALKIGYQTRELAFACEGDLLNWIDHYGDGRRSKFRTDRNYRIGLRYLREKKGAGAPQGNQNATKTNGSKRSICDSTADRIAKEERCSEPHVKRCAKMAAHVGEAIDGGLGFLRDLFLTERIKYSRALLDDLIFRGAGGCEQAIKTLLAENPDKALTPKMIRDALDGSPGGLSLPPSPPAVRAQSFIDKVIQLARQSGAAGDLAEIAGCLRRAAGVIERIGKGDN